MLLTALLVAVSALAAPTSAQAAPRVTISSSTGGATASTTGATTLQISGAGFQSLPNGFGGIYLMFGWVSDPGGNAWKPSSGGRVGDTMLYVPDSESKDNGGYQRFIAFPGSSTGESANGGTVAADGTFGLSLVVPGPTFTAQDRSGSSRSVDCREVQCGILTIGAHGVINAKNESFTPISFGAAAAPQESGGAGPGSQQPAAPASTPPRASSQPSAPADPAGGVVGAEPAAEEGDGVDVPRAPATVGLSQTTIQAGRVLGFTGQGFEPGEQVMGTVGAGLAGVGPLTAGRFGEVAGAIQLPVEMRAGTHQVVLSGAGSGQVAQASLSVMADPATVDTATEITQTTPDLWRWATIAIVSLAAVLLVLVVSSLVTAISRRGAAARSGKVRRRKQPGAQA